MMENLSGKRRLAIALGIVVCIMVVEVLGGVISNSLALLGDSGHMLVDALALGLALFAINIAARPATQQNTYGYHRVEIMVALVNGLILMLVAIVVVYNAYQRFNNPPQIQAGVMLVVAAVGLVANIIGIFFLRGAEKSSLNIKAAFWHVIGDTISSVGVILAAVIIYFTGWKLIDSIIAIIISGIIFWGAFNLVKESVNILLEAVPKNISLNDLIKEIKVVDGVEDVHEMHVWSITSGINSLSAHVVIKDQMISKGEEIVQNINEILARRFDIKHTTLQLECNTCSTGLVCSIDRLDND